ncbi:MAG: bifunctional hydroxymethylpyrimidine kinase/phosphomethylpyrimidine kinase, partial [Proteobacteria bacterium]|nr:bifunctional hydroxymethylpyrimidine kinase/phosphomethylpyrimidine kinase [Pseudomonadota bacterium]
MQVITIQSRVAHGYVGNAIAVPALQALGFDVWPIDTVRLSHHPGHGRPAGSSVPSAEVAAMLGSVLGRIGGAPLAMLIGYLGSVETGAQVMAEIERHRESGGKFQLIVDPVLGDDREGIYVDVELPDFYRRKLLPMADMVLPNRFELALLSGMTIDDAAGAVRAARSLIGNGTKT